MSGRILLIDDEALFREDLAELLRQEGFVVRAVGSGEEGLEAAQEEPFDLVLCDLMMPGMNGVDVIDRLASLDRETPVILVTAFGSMETAVEAFRKGAVDYLLKPLVPEDLFNKVRRCLEQRRLHREVRYLRRMVSEAGTGTTIVGESPAIRKLKELIDKVAPANTTLLISGESGTGKELVARVLHEGRWGPDRPFVAVNCSALPRELFESELFGHVRGAFTGAVESRAGYFELARGGTLFLDEIGELPLELQPKLLRAMETQEIMPVGASRAVSTDARLIAATNRDLRRDVEAGRFRDDLLYRIRVLEIELPPLRDRPEDIPLLVEHLLGKLGRRLGREPLAIDPAAMQPLLAAPWPGNVRELENVLERALLLAEGPRLEIEDLPAELTRGEIEPDAELVDDLRAATRAFERRHIRRVLAEVEGNREEAARRLGVNASTLYRRLKDLEI